VSARPNQTRGLRRELVWSAVTLLHTTPTVFFPVLRFQCSLQEPDWLKRSRDDGSLIVGAVIKVKGKNCQVVDADDTHVVAALRHYDRGPSSLGAL